MRATEGTTEMAIGLPHYLAVGAILLVLAVALVLAYAPRSGKATAAWRAIAASITR